MKKNERRVVVMKLHEQLFLVTNAIRPTDADLKENMDIATRYAEAISRYFDPPKTAKPKPESREARWHRLAAAGLDAAQALKEIQDEFVEWQDNLSENLSGSALGEKLTAICDIDLDTAVTSLEEADAAEVPLGYGRD